MSDNEKPSLLEQLKLSQSKERKGLQAKVSSLKHSVNKNDKKKKKEVSTLIESMEKELKDRQEQELKKLESQFSNITVNEVREENSDENHQVLATERKPTRAQKRRDKKLDEIKKRAIANAEDEANAEFSNRNIETNEIKRILLNINLKLHEIPPDGDCLYNALSYQINKGREFSGSQLRVIASKYIRENRDDFLPFLTTADGESVDEFGFDNYCHSVQKTSQEGGAWGGEAELRAISNALSRRIEVVQPNGCVILFGDDFTLHKPLVVTYHRFAYTLGEHYNSTVSFPIGDVSVNA